MKNKTDAQKISQSIKALCRKAGVKNKVSSYGMQTTVTFLSVPSNELIAAIDALETVEAHGDSMDDTRYYTGQSVKFHYDFTPSESVIEIAARMFENVKGWDNTSNYIKEFHFANNLKERGTEFLAIADYPAKFGFKF